jgi:two-component system, NtrC family, C4-dicarboxylate transport sensor histidine kinase DctB
MASARPRELRLVAYVAAGTAAGIVYVAFDVFSESRLETGTLTGAFAGLHAVVDRAFPILVGALLGVCAHYLRLRAKLAAAEEAAGRTEALRTRLQKTERDQAVWVLVAAVLHELNNPLHAVGLLLDELGEGGGDGAQRDELVARARSQAARALAHLEALRGMRGVGEPELQRVSLDRIVAALASDLGQLAAEDGLVVRVECPRAVSASADPAFVRTILENLFDNSLHALRGTGHGCITMSLAAESGRAVVRVSDDGPALDAVVRATLFEPLRTTKKQGLGLGLPIARALARSMRGELSIEENESKQFRLELPLGDAP